MFPVRLSGLAGNIWGEDLLSAGPALRGGPGRRPGVGGGPPARCSLPGRLRCGPCGLRAELAAWGQRLRGSDAKGRAEAENTLRPWRYELALAGLRDASALAQLPADERAGWQRLWPDVDALMAR